MATPIGGTAFRQTLLPPPGHYMILAGIGEWALDFRQQDGSRSRLPAPEGSAHAGALGLGRVFDGTLLGGHAAISAAGLAGRICLCFPARDPDRTQRHGGIGDAYAEAFWSRPLGGSGIGSPAADDPRRQAIPYGLTVAAALGGIVPIGQYSRTDLAPIGFDTPVLMWPAQSFWAWRRPRRTAPLPRLPLLHSVPETTDQGAVQAGAVPVSSGPATCDGSGILQRSFRTAGVPGCGSRRGSRAAAASPCGDPGTRRGGAAARHRSRPAVQASRARLGPLLRHRAGRPRPVGRPVAL